MSRVGDAVDRGCRRAVIAFAVVVFACSALSFLWAVAWGIAAGVDWLLP